MSDATPVPDFSPTTFDEFLEWELRQEGRYEFVDGVVYAMSGGSRPHNIVSLNVGAQLWIAAGEGPCHVYQQGQKLRIGRDLFYPDVMAVCEPDGDDERMAYGPCLLVEVLSTSSTHRDREQKLARYKTLPSLRAYLIVSQQYRHVERHWRDGPDASWRREDLTPADGSVPVPCPVEGALPFALIYRGTAVPERPTLRRVREQPAEGFIA